MTTSSPSRSGRQLIERVSVIAAGNMSQIARGASSLADEVLERRRARRRAHPRAAVTAAALTS